jgi:predicted nuclease with TOPRIM domain
MATGQELTALVQRRDRLRENVQRVKGRLDSAQKELSSVEEELRAKKVDPSQIDTVIAQLEQRLAQEIQTLTGLVEQAEAKLKPFLED